MEYPAVISNNTHGILLTNLVLCSWDTLKPNLRWAATIIASCVISHGRRASSWWIYADDLRNVFTDRDLPLTLIDPEIPLSLKDNIP